MFIAVSFIRAENEATQMSLSGLIDQQNMECPYGGILLSCRGEHSTTWMNPKMTMPSEKSQIFFF